MFFLDSFQYSISVCYAWYSLYNILWYILCNILNEGRKRLTSDPMPAYYSESLTRFAVSFKPNDSIAGCHHCRLHPANAHVFATPEKCARKSSDLNIITVRAQFRFSTEGLCPVCCSCSVVSLSDAASNRDIGMSPCPPLGLWPDVPCSTASCPASCKTITPPTPPHPTRTTDRAPVLSGRNIVAREYLGFLGGNSKTGDKLPGGNKKNAKE